MLQQKSLAALGSLDRSSVCIVFDITDVIYFLILASVAIITLVFSLRLIICCYFVVLKYATKVYANLRILSLIE